MDDSIAPGLAEHVDDGPLAEWPGNKVADGAVPVDVTGHSSADGDMRMSAHELGLHAQPPRKSDVIVIVTGDEVAACSMNRGV